MRFSHFCSIGKGLFTRQISDNLYLADTAKVAVKHLEISTGIAVRPFYFNHQAGEGFPADKKIYFPAILCPEVMQPHFFTITIFQKADFLEQGTGNQVFQANTGLTGNLAGDNPSPCQVKFMENISESQARAPFLATFTLEMNIFGVVERVRVGGSG